MISRGKSLKILRYLGYSIVVFITALPIVLIVLFAFAINNVGINFGHDGEAELERHRQSAQLRFADRTPQWSSDGQTIVVNIDDSVYAVSADGMELRRIPEKRSADSKYGEFSPTWLNEGRIAYRLYLDHGILEDNVGGLFDFITDPDGNYIESAKLDGTDVKRVAYTGDSISNPIASPDGSRIAFFTSEHGLSTAKSNGSDIRYSKNLLHGSEATWSDDGQSIALLVYSEAKQTHAVKTMRWDGTDVRTAVKFESQKPVLSSLEWSPDNETIYFKRSDRIDPASFLIRLYPVNSDGSGLRVMPFAASEVAVSPDGSALLFAEHDGVYIVNTDGTNLRNITSGYDFRSDVVYTNDGPLVRSYVGYASWSPDGSRIAVFYQDQYPIIDGHVVVLFTMARDGSDIRALITGYPPGPGHGELLQPAEDPAVTE